jgi:hypothetical protein
MQCHQQELLHPCPHFLYDAVNASCVKLCLKKKKRVVMREIAFGTEARTYALGGLDSPMLPGAWKCGKCEGCKE